MMVKTFQEDHYSTSFSLSRIGTASKKFDVKRMSILVMVYQHWVCLALHMQGNCFSARIDKHLNKFAP